MATLHTVPPAAAIPPANATNTLTHPPIFTPPVEPSATWKKLKHTYIFVILLIGITLICFTNESFFNENNQEINLADYSYGQIMVVEVRVDTKVKIKLPHSNIISYSSDEIETIDQYGISRNMDGIYFTSGPDATTTDFYILRNHSEETITVKFARYRNEEEHQQIKKKF